MLAPTIKLVASRRSLLTAGLSALVFAVAVPSSADAKSLEQELLKQAPQVLKYMQRHNYRNVGVLKFLVQKGNESASDNAGPFNLNIAQRLEIALVLVNEADAAKQIGILSRASEVAARTPGANHLTREGRQALFRSRYPMSWGTKEVLADAFVTGVVRLSADLREMTVAIQAFGKDATDLATPWQFTVATNPGQLADTGVSFLWRGIKDQDRLSDAAVIEAAARLRARQTAFPLADSAAPIALDIYYGKELQKPEIKDGVARIAEPREKQEVSFILRRKENTSADSGARGSAKERYAILLKINGENTLHQERLPSLQCRKWVLSPGDRPIKINGFFMPDNKILEFRVLSQEEAKQKEMNYGADVGTITMTVYREKRGKDDPVPPNDDESTIRRGRFPEDKPKTLEELKTKLRVSGKRKLIVDGQKIEGGIVRHVDFKTDPVPVMSAVISYYRP